MLTGEPPFRSAGSLRRMKTLRWLATAAREQGSSLFLATPSTLRIMQSGRCKFTGWSWSESAGQWVRSEVSAIRPIILDLMYLGDLKKHQIKYRLLKSRMNRSKIRYFNPALPGKDQLYVWLKRRTSAPVCLPRTKVVGELRDVYKYIAKHDTVWLKPVHGSGGRNMVKITSLGNQSYRVEGDAFFGKVLRETMPRKELSNFIKKTIERRKYLIQENIQLPQTQDGRKIDIRVTVQRDASGTWVVTATTLRKSAPKAAATNYHAGGERLSLRSPESASWLSSAKISQADILHAEVAALQAAKVLQSKFPTLGVLGVDVAPLGDCCYVYDCNSRPGRDILTNEEVQIWTERVVGFARYLETH